MIKTRKLTFVSIVILISLVSALVFPITVLADDSTPPPAETPEVVPPTEEPVVLEEASPTEVPVEPQATGVPADEESSEIDVAEIVQAAAENNITLAEPSGDPFEYATVAASEALTYGDPYFISGGVTYRFYAIGGCAVWGALVLPAPNLPRPSRQLLRFLKLISPIL